MGIFIILHLSYDTALQLNLCISNIACKVHTSHHVVTKSNDPTLDHHSGLGKFTSVQVGWTPGHVASGVRTEALY